MSFLGAIGETAIRRLSRFRYLAAVIWGVLVLGCRGSSWRRTVRAVLARQIVFSGVDALYFVSVIAVLTGISVVVQAQVWISRLGQAELLGPVLVAVVVREVGPLLVNLIIIGRSGTAITTELAGMRLRREVQVLDAQGLDPLVYLVMPRVLAMAIAVLCLTVFFVFLALGSGYLYGLLIGTSPGEPRIFVATVVRGLRPSDVLNLLAKTLIPGLVAGAICSIEGMSVGALATDMPQAVTRAVVRANAAVLFISLIVSVLAYA
jgi:phospholipid/cholesterol/gamma-HCH transport system permease protein